MFFAQSLGPLISRRSGAAIFEHVATKLAGRSETTTAELRAILSEFLTSRGIDMSPDAAIQYLEQGGRLVQADAKKVHIAA